MPELTENFAIGASTLPVQYDEGSYYHFLEAFGTHYISKLKMGARYGYLSVFEEENWKSIVNSDLKIEQAASLSGWGITGNDNFLNHDNQKQVDEFNSKKESHHVFSLGTKPPESGKEDDWV